MIKIILIIALFVLNQIYSQNNDNEEHINSLTCELKMLQKQGYINGFSVAIVNKDAVLYKKGFGYADVSKKKEYTPHTIQNIASVSKTLIGIALMKVQEQGKLNLDDPVNIHLPFNVINPHYPQTPITIRHLATHTSTILDTKYYDKSYILKNNKGTDKGILMKKYRIFNDPEETIALPIFLKNLLSIDGEWYKKRNYLKNKPGSIFKYSNIGATLAAYIIERVTGIPYDEYTITHILKPLGMDASGWSFDTIDMDNHSVLYSSSNDSLPKYSLITYPDGGLLTDITDFSKYLIELIKGYYGAGTLLDKNSYTELFKEQLSSKNLPNRNTKNPYNEEYNSGLFMGITPVGYIGHTGSDPGTETYMFFNSKTGTGKILVINTAIVTKEDYRHYKSIMSVLDKYERLLTYESKI
ncbi:serine hydrolase domain-containing protein [Aquimarina megaterium]|uniref:serine hydrolase domain-containing protein n=1 Tax=Aquimarina megaterium TaxID=1443666 RepID=UPI00046F6F66|nr:serine hydrolase domain-containing protein [Aquimarina megaterium]